MSKKNLKAVLDLAKIDRRIDLTLKALSEFEINHHSGTPMREPFRKLLKSLIDASNACAVLRASLRGGK